jgi:hypothetical protein
VLELHHVHDLPAHDLFYDWLFLLGERRRGADRRAYP